MNDPSIVAVACHRAGYPTGSRYGPDPAFPEVQSGGADQERSSVYEMVRSVLAAAGCDRESYGTADWNPFRDFVDLGQRVHVLPNFVMHRRESEREVDSFFAKVTHASVLQPVLDYAIKATGTSALVSVGNASLQGCDYRRVLQESGLVALLDSYYTPRGQQVTVVDLRGLRTRWDRSGALRHREETDEPLVMIDLGAESLLEPLYARDANPRFRVGDYPPSETTSYHSRGRHVYAVNRRVLDADLIVSVPKLKTHEKVGITCALKGTVGAIGRKECLAHHRHGGPASGGDEFPRETPFAWLTSWLLEAAAEQPIALRGSALRILSKTAFRAMRVVSPGSMGGAWHGNDTAWRMTLDIARILLYARPDGTLAPSPQRRHIAIVDGVISGEGGGPLRPTPRRSNAILFGSDPVAVDWTCALLMGFDPSRIPLVAQAFANFSRPLTSRRPEGIRFLLNGASASANDLSTAVTPPHSPPGGWLSRLSAPAERR